MVLRLLNEALATSRGVPFVLAMRLALERDAMGIFDSWRKDKAKPDFTNVRNGASSTAPAPEPQADGDSSPLGAADTQE